MITRDARRTTDDDGRQPVALGHLSYSGDQKRKKINTRLKILGWGWCNWTTRISTFPLGLINQMYTDVYRLNRGIVLLYRMMTNFSILLYEVSLHIVSFFSLFQHWECKMLFTVFNYVMMASYMWIFVEGLHLHTLIMVSVFSERSSVKWYLCIGWGTYWQFEWL